MNTIKTQAGEPLLNGRPAAVVQALRQPRHESHSSWAHGRQPGAPRQRAVADRLRGDEIVLLVDPAPLPRWVLARMLRQLGYEVLEAAGALDAQRVAMSFPRIDLLLLNLARPQTVDFQLALWFRALHPETKVLLASDSLWDLNFHLTVSHQIALLAKPFNRRELADMLRQLLDSASRPAAVARAVSSL